MKKKGKYITREDAIARLLGGMDEHLREPYSEYIRMLIYTVPDAVQEPQWIPCEERLPKPNVAVLGYAPAFHNIFTVCYDSVCGWMTWCPACDEPFPSWQGEIVAWMPLPEPYEGERKDDE